LFSEKNLPSKYLKKLTTPVSSSFRLLVLEDPKYCEIPEKEVVQEIEIKNTKPIINLFITKQLIA
jgi:hypothetical protein